MKKKLIAIVLTVAMMCSLAGCQEKSNEGTTNPETKEETKDADAGNDLVEQESTVTLDGSWPEETVKIGVECFDTTDDQFLNLQKYYDYLAESYNIEFMYSESITSAEDELAFIENCASAGCSAIIGYYNVSETEAVQLTIDKGMYYWGNVGTKSIYTEFAENEFYLGGYDAEDADFAAGYTMAEELIKQGSEKLVYVSGGRDFGVDMFIKRSEGFYKAVEDAKADNGNVEIVYDVSGWPGTDSFTAGQTEVVDMDFDALGCSFSAAVWFQPLANANKMENTKIATIGIVGDTYYDFANSGLISPLIYDCEELFFGNAIPMILNAVSGNGAAIRNGSTAANFTVDRWVINNPEDYNRIYELHNGGNYVVTAEDVAKCIVNFNKDASYETLKEVYSGITLEAAFGK